MATSVRKITCIIVLVASLSVVTLFVTLFTIDYIELESRNNQLLKNTPEAQLQRILDSCLNTSFGLDVFRVYENDTHYIDNNGCMWEDTTTEVSSGTARNDDPVYPVPQDLLDHEQMCADLFDANMNAFSKIVGEQEDLNQYYSSRQNELVFHSEFFKEWRDYDYDCIETVNNWADIAEYKNYIREVLNWDVVKTTKEYTNNAMERNP